jgi:4-amino-4-deoxy-L-arabinose transferase-like glycosyltransferase
MTHGPAPAALDSRAARAGIRALSARIIRVLRSLPRLARTHWLFAIVLLLGTAGRVLTMLAYRPALLYIDSWGYLNNRITLYPGGGQPIGYPLVLKLLVALGGTALVVAVQHLLGLAMGWCVYALLRRNRVPRWLAAPAAAPVLLDAYEWQIEQYVLTDSLFLAILTAGLALLTWRRRTGPVAAAVAGFLLGLAVMVRLVGEAAIVPALLFVLLAASPGRLRRLLAGAALLGAFFVPLLANVVYMHVDENRYSFAESDGNLIYGRAATFADCSSLPANLKPLCPGGTVAYRESVGPDYYAHAPGSPLAHASQALEHPFAVYVIEHQPLNFAVAVGRDFLALFLSPRQTVFGGTDITRWQFQTAYPQWSDDHAAAEEFATFGDSGPYVNVGLATALRDYQLGGGYTPGYLFGGFLLAGIAGSAGLTRAARRSPLRAKALLWTLSGGALLLAADLFEFSWRYQLPALTLLPVAGALGATALFQPGGARRPRLAAFPDAVDAQAVAAFHERYGDRAALAELVIVIAAYNEAEAIGPVLEAMPAECLGMKAATLVVVDGATDATAEIALAHGAYTCVAPANRGQGAALRLGYRLAHAAGARYIVTTDADGQYDINGLPELLAPLMEDRADFVTGSRVLGGHETTDPVRRLGCRVFAAIVSILMRTRVTDTSFGLRAMRADVPAGLTLEQPQYQSAELLIGVLAGGHRVAEVPMTIKQRAGGRTKKGNNLVYGARYARVVFTTWRRERRAKAGAPAESCATAQPDSTAAAAARDRFDENTSPSYSANLITKTKP